MSATENLLLQTGQFLARQLQADPRLCLATTMAWLDPVWFVAESEESAWDIPEDDDSALTQALRVLRRSFPGIYVGALEAIRNGERYHDIEHLICAAMYAQGIPLDDLHWMVWGIPMPAYGTTLTAPAFYESNPDLVPIVELFGIQPTGADRSVHVSDSACIAGRIVGDSLMAQDEPHYQQLAWLLQWLFGWSGNTCIDLDQEALCELELPTWDAAGIELAQAVIAEADDILKQAQAGLTWLTSQPTLLVALRKNVRRTVRRVEKKGDQDDELTIRLHWPRLADGADRAAALIA